MILRDYQNEISDAVYREWQSVNSTLVVAPTGTGKTVIFSDIIRRMFPRRAMVLAHRQVLVEQAAHKIHEVTGLRCDVEMGDMTADHTLFGKAPVVVSSIQTQSSGNDGGGRKSKFNPNHFGLLIIDEAHRGVSDQYRKAIEYYKTNPKLKIVGFTATPDRLDEKALGQVFESVACDYEIVDMINRGWLVPIEQKMVHVQGLDYSAIRTTAGDLNGADLASVMEAEKTLHPIASASLDMIGDRRTLVFASSVKHAQMLSEIFNRHKAGMSDWVCGKTPKDDRFLTLQRFASGETQVVCNFGVLGEGYDNPAVEVVVMGRPTKSRSNYSQWVGRSTRPLPGVVDPWPTPEERRAAIASSPKPCCTILDFVGVSGKHKLVTAADILGGNVSDEVKARAIEKIRKSSVPIDVNQALLDAEEEEKRLAEERRLADEARRSRLVVKASYRVQSVDPFDALDIQPSRNRAWDDGKSLSDKQRTLLAKQGVNPDTIGYSDGKRVIAELFSRWQSDLCSLKQAALLKRYNYPTDITRDAAKKLIDALAANHWHKPL